MFSCFITASCSPSPKSVVQNEVNAMVDRMNDKWYSWETNGRHCPLACGRRQRRRITQRDIWQEADAIDGESRHSNRRKSLPDKRVHNGTHNLRLSHRFICPALLHKTHTHPAFPLYSNCIKAAAASINLHFNKRFPAEPGFASSPGLFPPLVAEENRQTDTHLMASLPGTKKVKPFWISRSKMMGRHWYQLDHLQIICTSLQTDNHASTSSPYFHTLDALSVTQPTVSKAICYRREHFVISGPAFISQSPNQQRQCYEEKSVHWPQ